MFTAVTNVGLEGTSQAEIGEWPMMNGDPLHELNGRIYPNGLDRLEQTVVVENSARLVPSLAHSAPSRPKTCSPGFCASVRPLRKHR